MTSSNDTPSNPLDSVLSPSKGLPKDDLMIKTALGILKQSPHSQPLVEMVERENIHIKVIKTPEETTYLPDTRQVYIGVTQTNPTSPARFVLLLAGALREAQQELEGKKHPPLNAPMEEHLKVSGHKFADKAYHLCAIATDLNDLESFTEYNFLNELSEMGFGEALDIYLKEKS